MLRLERRRLGSAATPPASYLLARNGGVLFVGDAAVATRRGEVRRGWMNASTPTFDASLEHLAGFEFDVALFSHSVALPRAAGA